MKKFFMELMNSDSPTSSKRFAGLITLFSCIALAFTAASQSHWVCPEFMYNGLLLVVAGLFGFNMAENIFKKKPDVVIPEVPKEEDKVESSKEEAPKEEVTEEEEESDNK